MVVPNPWRVIDPPPDIRASLTLVESVLRTGMKKRFTEEQILVSLKEADAGNLIKELCRKHGFSDALFYTWRSKFSGLEVSDAKRVKAIDQENARLKKLLAETMLHKKAEGTTIMLESEAQTRVCKCQTKKLTRQTCTI